MCSSSDPSRFPCVCFASIRSITTAFSGENGTTVCRGGDRHRKRFDRTSCETSVCYSGAITTVSATRRRRFRLRDRSFLTLLTGFVAQIQQCNALPLRINSRVADLLSTKIPLVVPGRCALAIKEAGAGIEPANSGFADRDLTTWLPRRFCESGQYRCRGACIKRRA